MNLVSPSVKKCAAVYHPIGDGWTNSCHINKMLMKLKQYSDLGQGCKTLLEILKENTQWNFAHFVTNTMIYKNCVLSVQ